MNENEKYVENHEKLGQKMKNEKYVKSNERDYCVNK